MTKYLGVNFYRADITHFCFLEKNEYKVLNYHFFAEKNIDWKNHVDFINEKVNYYQIDKVFIRDFRWMPYPHKEIFKKLKNNLCVRIFARRKNNSGASL